MSFTGFIATHSYSFDNEKTARYFPTFEEAWNYIEKDAEKEFRIQVDENGRMPIDDPELIDDGTVLLQKDRDAGEIRLYTWYFRNSDPDGEGYGVLDKDIDFYDIYRLKDDVSM